MYSELQLNKSCVIIAMFYKGNSYMKKDDYSIDELIEWALTINETHKINYGCSPLFLLIPIIFIFLITYLLYIF